MRRTRPRTSAGISFIIFIDSMTHRTWPGSTSAPTSTNGGASGPGPRWKVPTMGAATMTSLRPAFSFATGPRSADSARPPLSRITRMSLRISAMSMRGGRAPFTRMPAARANRTGRRASVDADALGRVVGRVADALAVKVREAQQVFVAGAGAVRLPLWDHAEPEAGGRRVRVALLPVVDAAVAAAVA